MSSDRYRQGAVDWDPDEIIESHGACLVTQPPTPNRREYGTAEFATRLHSVLQIIAYRQEKRLEMYGALAEEYPIGYTPTSVREQRDAYLKEVFEYYDVTSPDSDDPDPEPRPPPPRNPFLPTPSSSSSTADDVAALQSTPEPRGQKRRLDEPKSPQKKRRRTDASQSKPRRSARLRRPAPTKGESQTSRLLSNDKAVMRVPYSPPSEDEVR